jgi:hypothetical protein
MSSLTVQNIQGSASSSNTINVASGHVLNAPGHVIQVQQKVLLTRATVSSNTYADVGVSQAITPSSASSKILVTCSGTLGNSAAGNNTSLKLFRDSTEIGTGTGGDTYNAFVTIFATQTYDMKGFSQNFLDSPNTTSQITYTIKIAAFNATGSFGSRGDSTSVQNPTTLTLMEIAQ